MNDEGKESGKRSNALYGAISGLLKPFNPETPDWEHHWLNLIIIILLICFWR